MNGVPKTTEGFGNVASGVICANVLCGLHKTEIFANTKAEIQQFQIQKVANNTDISN